MATVGEEKTLLAWESEERLFKQRSKDFYSTVMVLAVLIGIVFFFIEGVMPVLVVGAVVFVVFVLSRTEPSRVKHEITDRGIITAGDRYVWGELLSYWLDDQDGRKILNVMTARRWPVRLVLVLPKDDAEATEEKVKEIVGKYIPLEKPTVTRMDRAVKWLGEKIPLEE